MCAYLRCALNIQEYLHSVHEILFLLDEKIENQCKTEKLNKMYEKQLIKRHTLSTKIHSELLFIVEFKATNRF